MSNARKYKVTLTGCDDATVLSMELTAQEHGLIHRLSELTYAHSTNRCMPVIDIEEADQ